jgi:hypothetical protein
MRQSLNSSIDDKCAYIGSDNDDSDHNDDSIDDDSQSNMSDKGFKQDIITLRNYSFISDNSHGTAFEMHALVQLATREWLKAHQQQER